MTRCTRPPGGSMAPEDRVSDQPVAASATDAAGF